MGGFCAGRPRVEPAGPISPTRNSLNEGWTVRALRAERAPAGAELRSTARSGSGPENSLPNDARNAGDRSVARRHHNPHSIAPRFDGNRRLLMQPICADRPFDYCLRTSARRDSAVSQVLTTTHEAGTAHNKTQLARTHFSMSYRLDLFLKTFRTRRKLKATTGFAVRNCKNRGNVELSRLQALS